MKFTQTIMRSKTYKGIIGLFMALAISLFSWIAKADVYCDPAKSFPCGNGCARNGAQCSYSWSTSKVGINPNKGKGKRYKPAEVKLVDKSPESDKTQN